MRLMLLTLLLLAPPLTALKLKLKAEAREFEASELRLQGDSVIFTRARKELTAALDDFEPASALQIKRRFTPEEGHSYLELARFALHRALYAAAVEIAHEAARLDTALTEQSGGVASTARTLHADALLEQGADLLHRQQPAKAREALARVIEEFGDTPARAKAEVLAGTLARVELEIHAAELEAAARQAQQDADAVEQTRRKPIDDWLEELQNHVETHRKSKSGGDTENLAGRLHRGLPIYEEVVKAMTTIRKRLAENRAQLTYRGQPEQADAIDEAARKLMVDSYERWVYYLYSAARYQAAAALCNAALRLAPADRRLLALKIDIDNMYDPLQK